MVTIKDINYVAFLSIVKDINFDTYIKRSFDNGRKEITAFIYEKLDVEEYNRAIADYHKSDISKFVSKLRTLKTIVHDNGENNFTIDGTE